MRAGKHLAIVIALNLFVAVIPLIIISYAFISAFNPHRDVGNMLASNLHLSPGRRPVPPLIYVLSPLKTSSLMLEIVEVAERRATPTAPG